MCTGKCLATSRSNNTLFDQRKSQRNAKSKTSLNMQICTNSTSFFERSFCSGAQSDAPLSSSEMRLESGRLIAEKPNLNNKKKHETGSNFPTFQSQRASLKF